MNIICCDSCGVGDSSTPMEEIESQKAKYNGIYICKYCEETVKKINQGTQFKTGLGLKLMIAANGMYYHDGNRIESSTKPFLGYGGRWFLIETINETYVTNNLFSFTSFHPILSAKINPRKIYIKSIKNISKEEADEFRESQKVIKQLTSKF